LTPGQVVLNKETEGFLPTAPTDIRFRIEITKKAETYAKRIQQFVEMLEKNEKFH